MKLQPMTIALLITAAVLGGVVYFTQERSSSQSETPETTDTAKTELFSFEEEQIQSFSIDRSGEVLKFEKDSQGVWQMQAPVKAIAKEASVVYLLNLLATARSDRTLTATAQQKQTYGLVQPRARIDIQLDNEKTHQLIVGDFDFNHSFLYAQVDPNPTAIDQTVMLVSPDFENAINRPLADWKQSSEPQPSATPE
jgi:hypothetical protein